jgi:hypothetical protein
LMSRVMPVPSTHSPAMKFFCRTVMCLSVSC